jgi:hypothetical protein
MKSTSPKAIYRIFNKLTNKYISTGSKSKSTWQRISGAIDAAESYAQRYNSNIYTGQILSKNKAKQWAAQNLELHIFPVTKAEVVTLEDYYKQTEALTAQRLEIAERKKQQEAQAALLKQIKYYEDMIKDYTEKLKKIDATVDKRLLENL